MGFGVPMSRDRWTASVYRCPCVEAIPTVEASLRALADLSDADHRALSALLPPTETRPFCAIELPMARMLAQTP